MTFGLGTIAPLFPPVLRMAEKAGEARAARVRAAASNPNCPYFMNPPSPRTLRIEANRAQWGVVASMSFSNIRRAASRGGNEASLGMARMVERRRLYARVFGGIREFFRFSWIASENSGPVAVGGRAPSFPQVRLL